MTLGTNLSIRIAAILIAGFVAIQFLVFGAMVLPGRQTIDRPYSFPPPAQLAAVVDTLEEASPERRAMLVATLDSSLYSLSVEPGMAGKTSGGDATARSVESAYRAALPGHNVRFSLRHVLFPRLIRNTAWPGRLFPPAVLSVSLHGGGALVLTTRPSALVRDFIGERAAVGALAGLLLLVILAWAVRQSTRPVTRLAGNIRTFSTSLDAPDLPVEGGPELRDLAAAYNDMKARIASLVSERTRILAGIAHDLRTYLTRLQLRAEFIDDADQRARASRDLAEMALLLDDTLLFAQPTSRPPALERFAIGTELASLVETRREMGDEVTLEALADDPQVLAERLSLRRAIANLIDNGLRHGTTVSIRVRETDGIEIIVADDGPGVPQDMLPRLGQAFDRLDPSRDRTTGGAGLGLAIVRALMDRQGGLASFRNGEQGGLEVVIALQKG